MEAVKKPVARARLTIERARADHGWFDVAYRTFKRFGEDEGPTFAAALTYFTFFSIFPLLLFATAALGYITFGNEALQDRLIQSGLSTIPILKDALTPDGLEIIQKNKGSIALTGAALALYTGTGAIAALNHALNQINHVEKERNFLQKRLVAVVWLGVLGLAALASLALSVASGALPGIAATILGAIGAIAVSTGLFATAFRFLTTKQQSWRDVLPGAFVAAIGFEILKQVGSWFIERGDAGRNATFGAFAGAAALLIASYLISQIVLLSAEVNAVLAERRAARQASPAIATTSPGHSRGHSQDK
ncbi:MAG: YihY/virulence factor BrkB family protein [Actinomycetota bacterium]|nr:YihY/virulence factor BrkB family protein [Actinomycetota bacterium]